MPLPGPRTQFGQEPGYRNPTGATPDRFNDWEAPKPVFYPGQTPGTMQVDLRLGVLALGTIRKMWRQSVNYTGAQFPYSNTANGTLQAVGRGFQITRALRYMTRSVYQGAGIDHTRFDGLHTVIPPKVNSRPVTIGAGNSRSQPTVRNRMTSFGSRVPTLNVQVQAAQTNN